MINRMENCELVVYDRTRSPFQLFLHIHCGINSVLAFEGDLEVGVFPHSLGSICICYMLVSLVVCDHTRRPI